MAFSAALEAAYSTERRQLNSHHTAQGAARISLHQDICSQLEMSGS